VRCFDFDIITREELDARGDSRPVFAGPSRPAPGVRVRRDPCDRRGDYITVCTPSYADACETGEWTTAYVTGGEA
jgi:hypothetical protein